LRQMIRNLVSTQLELFARGCEPGEILRLLELKDRTKIGRPAPPVGLFMNKVYFPSELTRQSIPFGTL
jgi:tRNA U38,U39,U40 pseudouridine synthase TruA